jgi:hypothetical protein
MQARASLRWTLRVQSKLSPGASPAVVRLLEISMIRYSKLTGSLGLLMGRLKLLTLSDPTDTFVFSMNDGGEVTGAYGDRANHHGFCQTARMALSPSLIRRIPSGEYFVSSVAARSCADQLGK